MKIMFLLFSFTTGGTERLVADMCNELIKNGQEIYLYIVNNLHEETILKTVDEKVHIELQNREPGAGKLFSTIKKVTRYIRSNNIDVVHCNSFDAPMLLILKSLFFRKTKVIQTIHDVGQYDGLSKIEIKVRNSICDEFIAISDCVKKDIFAHGVPNNKITVVYNAINLEKFKPNGEKSFDPNHVIIGNVARFVPEKKGQDILVDAIGLLKEKYPGMVCYFAGGYDAGHQEAFNRIKKKVKKMKLEDNVVFCGNVDDIPLLLKSLDVFILPSRYEGFGISLIEAMAMELPCIASRLDGPEEVLEYGARGGLFEVGNPQELAKCIDECVMSYTEKKKVAIANRNIVEEKYSIGMMIKRLLDVYCSND